MVCSWLRWSNVYLSSRRCVENKFFFNFQRTCLEAHGGSYYNTHTETSSNRARLSGDATTLYFYFYATVNAEVCVQRGGWNHFILQMQKREFSAAVCVWNGCWQGTTDKILLARHTLAAHQKAVCTREGKLSEVARGNPQPFHTITIAI